MMKLTKTREEKNWGATLRPNWGVENRIGRNCVKNEEKAQHWNEAYLGLEQRRDSGGCGRGL